MAIFGYIGMNSRKKLINLFYFVLILFSFNLNATINSMSEQFSRLAADYEKSLFDYSPELGIFWGRAGVALDRFTDYSLTATMAWQAQEEQFLIALNALDEQELKHTSQYATYLLFKETLENKKASRLCKEELWSVDPTFGWHNKLAIVAEKQPVGTTEYRQLALSRWRSFASVVDTQIVNLKTGLSLGYSAPKPAVIRVLTQLKLMTGARVEESPFFVFAKRDSDELFKEQIRELILQEINPALKKYQDYLENEYLLAARSEVGVWAIPEGEQCYQNKIREYTTLEISPQEIHQLGLAKMEKLTEEIADIGMKKYGTKDMATIFQRAQEESLHAFSTEQDLLDYNFAALNRAKAKVKDWFDLMPKAEGTIKPFPLHRAKTGASGEYHPPSEDGKEPGVFFINTFEAEKRSRIDKEATLFHELVPGHHFQIALVYEDKAIPHLNRYLWNSGFGEGWALYAERLADEMGLYCDDISRLGMLSNEALRAARLVVDTGMHALHWRREQAIDYLVQHTALDPNLIEGEVDRYLMMPGQATSYMLGKTMIEDLREMAKKRLGSAFDIRQFHNQVLKNGVVSLTMLRQQIKNWLHDWQSEEV